MFRNNWLTVMDPFDAMDTFDRAFFSNPFFTEKSSGDFGFGTDLTDEGDAYKLTADLPAKDTDLSGQLLLLTDKGGHLYIDVVSLFPETWNNRPNGLRPDLAQLLADTKPTFLRFPGGCFVEGQNSFDDTWQWKRTIGPIEQRHGHMSYNWNYWSSDGLGFDE